MGKRLQPRPPGSVTIFDVAEQAGVSISTVSRALSGQRLVRPVLVERVKRAAEAVGYVPHQAARTLASRRSRIVGAVVPTIDNAIFSRAIQALQQRLDAGGYRLLLATTEYNRGREVDEVHSLVRHGVDALVLVGSDHDAEVLELVANKALPFVNTWTTERATGGGAIGFDNHAAMTRVVRHLLSIGHRQIAMIAGVGAGNDRARARSTAFREAMQSAGHPPGEHSLVECPYTLQDGRAALRWAAESRPRPTAVVCGNDVLALGALIEARAMGITVPRQMSITGFDDLDLASQFTPALTTVRVPSAAMGELAADYLLARLDGRSVPDLVALEAELIVRESTAPPPRRRRSGAFV